MANEKTAIQGQWRIVEMETWDRDALDLVGPATISFDGEEGELRFIAITAWLDVRYGIRDGKPLAEFSWEGVSEGDQISGRGWAMLETGGTLAGHIFIHNSDDSWFKARPK